MKDLSVKRLNRILSILFSEIKDLNDDDRDLPLRWSVMHMYTTTQIAKIIAIKRGLDPELSGLIAALHDIAVIKTRRKENHAVEAEKFIIELIELYNSQTGTYLPVITEAEKDLIIDSVTHHSEKHIQSENQYIELMKDVDSFDRYLHGVKTENEYLDRCNTIFKELNLE